MRLSTSKIKFISTIFLLLLALVLIFICAIFRNGFVYAASEQEASTDIVNRYLAFDISTGSYVSGTIVEQTKAPTIEITLSGNDPIPNNTELWYCAKDTLNVPDENDQWTKANALFSSVGIKPTLTINSITFVAEEQTTYNKYIFFQTKYSTSDVTYYYKDPRFINLIIDTAPPINSQIKSVLIEQKNSTGQYVSYDAFATLAPWVSTSLRLTVTRSDNATGSAWYYLEDGKEIPLNGTGLQLTVEIDATSLSESPYFGAYSGRVRFVATDGSTNTKYQHSQVFNIRIDTRQPAFSVSATKQTGTIGDNYTIGSWSPYDVRYVLNSEMTESTYGSNAAFYYTENPLAANLWLPLQPLSDTSGYIDITSTKLNLSFKAVSEAGMEFQPDENNWITRIDKVTPILSLKAQDSTGSEVKTEGSPTASDYKTGYASDYIFFTGVNIASNTSPVTFAYADITENPDTTTIEYLDSSQTTPYEKNFNYDSSKISRTYIFRAISGAGLKSEVKFTVSVVPSTFSVDFNEPIEFEKINGWGNTAIVVSLKVQAVMGVSFEFDFSYAAAGSQQPIPLNDVEYVRYDSSTGFSIYNVKITDSINKQVLRFTATNKALNTSYVDTSEQIWLDLKEPTALIERRLTNSNQTIEDDGWAYGKVTIYITPNSGNLSGINCYPLLNGVPTQPLTYTNNQFLRDVTASGEYHFRLETGSGLITDYVVKVNIDQTEIVLNQVFAYTGFSVGNNYDEILLEFVDNTVNTTHEVKQTVSSNVVLKFDSTHDGHFNIYYQIFTTANPADSAYIWIDSEELLIDVLSNQVSATGIIQCAFYLESKAVDSNGSRKKTPTHILKVKYDINSFTIEASYIIDQSWSTAPVIFVLRSTVNIKEYQYRTHSDDGTSTDWNTINGDISVDNGAYTKSFNFGGFEYIYNGRSIGYGFSGTMYFRAISYANAISNELAGIALKINIVDDQESNPNPLNVIPTSFGMLEISKEVWQIYSNTEQNNLISVPTDSVFKNFAPIIYYMMSYSEAEDVAGPGNKPSRDDFLDKHKISASTSLVASGYLCAISESTNQSNIIKITLYNENSIPKGTMYPVGAAKNSAGIYEYNWTDRVVISLTITNIYSESAVFFEFKLGNESIYINSDSPIQATAYGVASLTVIFCGELNFGEKAGLDSNSGQYIYVGNYDAMVVFSVKTLGGLTVDFGNSGGIVRVKIDVLIPKFNIEALQEDKVVTTALSGVTDTTTNWLSKEVYLKIVPVDPTITTEGKNPVAGDKVINPSGVIYKYAIGENNTEFSPLPGGGKYFSLDELITSNDVNGIFVIKVKAIVRGSAKESVTTITIQIDRIIPVFEINAWVIPEGSADSQYLASGEWTRSKSVTLMAKLTQIPKDPLVVTYQYYLTTNPDNRLSFDGSLSIQEISKVVIIAKNTAGLEYSQQFDVNIDFTPPIIHSGIIQNNSSWVDNKEIINYDNPFKYYIDQTITYTENNLKSAYYNGFPLINGATIGTNTVDNSNGGYVHIVVEDLAGNKAELVFYMTVFELTVNTITLSNEHKELLATFKSHFDQAVESGALTDAPRKAYFNSRIIELQDRLSTLQKEVDLYKAYLDDITVKTQFSLSQDYEKMYSYIILFISPDQTIRYPEWQQNEIKAGPNYTAAYAKLLTEYNKLRVLMEAVENLESEVRSLPAVNVVEKDNYTNILRSYNVYTNLATTQKGVFDTALYTKLLELKRRCELLLLQDDASGVKISGDNLSPGIALEILEYDNTSEYVLNAQKMLLSAMPSTSPRAVIYVKKLMLSDLGAQFNTGDIEISLNIPDEYKEYIKFGVYRLSSDGTASPIDNITIDAFGSTITFSSKSLDTYILAVHADVTVAPEEENVITILDIPIDYVMLTYITYVAAGLFGLALVVLIVVGLRQRAFVKKYDKNYKNSLVKRGLGAVPKGNPSPRSNPAKNGKERLKYD
ncbi:MAG: hypothetical protein LBF12_03045 [Christensenellaceae bacterium]|jgi:hypothetical protein|nr:hypothetical protein [Christensenellaceae bacterium]